MASIELEDSVVRRLSEKAAAEGLSLEALLKQLAEPHFVENGMLPRLTRDELEQFLDEEASDATTYQGTYAREDIYLDHD